MQKSLWALLTWFIQITYQLECLECTGLMAYNIYTSDSSCLDGTSIPVRCQSIRNESEVSKYQCITSIYRGGQYGISGVYINRGCTKRRQLQHDCDPPLASIDVDGNGTFYCSYTCEGNGCNRHSVDIILSNGNHLYAKDFVVLNSIFLGFFGCKLVLFS